VVIKSKTTQLVVEALLDNCSGRCNLIYNWMQNRVNSMSGTQKCLLPLLALIAILYGTPGWSDGTQYNSGERQLALIELYTSQGCNSCPPAERWLGNLQQDPRLWRELIPVAFHVDYWDSLGWKDQLAKPAFSERQRRYRREAGINVVYTPAFLVNGHEWRRWFGLKALPVSKKRVGALKLTLNGKTVEARFEPSAGSERTLVLNIAILGTGLVAEVTRGENAGKRLPQDFSVLAHRQLRSDTGRWQTTLPEIKPADGVRLAIAAWVSRSDSLKPLQAVGGWLPTTNP
jgi:hypothetical protein